MASAQDSRYGQKDTSDQNFDYMFKLLIIGNSSVGKTSFLFQYTDDSFTSAFVSTFDRWHSSYPRFALNVITFIYIHTHMI
uniref:Uncharacterized protein n=1 Tax=Otus sunia TaxID=257818 RepID=A0A8C8B4K6_9STRI